MTDPDAELRRLEGAPPSEAAWEALVTTLDGLDTVTDDRFDALRGRLASWPANIRRLLPLRWIFDGPILVGHRCPLRPRPWPRAVELATHLDLSASRQPSLTSSGGELLRLFEAGELTGLCSIDLGLNGASAKQWSRIASRGPREALRHLAMRSVDSRTAQFLSGPCFAALEHLDLRRGGLGPADVRMLVEAPTLSRLTRLVLSHNPIEDAGLALLAGSRCLTGDLASTKVTDAGVAHLARGASLSKLEALDLSDNRVGPSGVASLMASSELENLRALDLRGCAMGSHGASAIASAPHLWLLRALGLRGGKIGAAGLAALVEARWFAGLEELDLSYCDLDDAALRSLVRVRSSRLRRLHLDGSRAITAHALGHLLASPAGENLEELSLHGCTALGPHGAATLARSSTSARLRILNLQNCKIGADGARALANSPHLGGLRELWIWTGDLLSEGGRSAEGARAMLENAFPAGTVIG